MYAGIPIPPAVRKFFTNRKVAPARPLTTSTSQRLPPLQDYGPIKSIATEPRGIGRVAALGGKAVDPRARADTPAARAVITYETSLGIGRGHANRVKAEMHGEFGHDAVEWKGQKVKLANGTEMALADAVENEMKTPGSVPFDAKGLEFVRQWVRILNEAKANAIANGRPWETKEGDPISPFYFPRISLEGTAGQTGVGRTSAGRFFKTEQEGIDAGVKYVESAIDRVSEFVKQQYRSDAEFRLANDPVLGGQTVAEYFADAKLRHAAKISQMNPADQADFLKRLWDDAASKPGEKDQPGSARRWTIGKIYPEESAKLLTKHFGQKPYDWLTTVENVNDGLKAMKLAWDVAVGQLQGAPLALRNPKAWATATYQSIRRVISGGDGFAELMRDPENRTAASLYIQAHGSLGESPDFFAGGAQGGPIGRIPGAGRYLGPVFERFERSISTFFDVAKLMQWKSYLAKNRPQSEWPAMVEAMENTLGQGRSATIGVNRGQRLAEKLAVIAPSYYRSLLNQLGEVAYGPWATKIETAKALGATLAGMAALAIGGMIAVGLKEDEILERLDPTKSKFMTVPVPLPDGKKQEIGPGGLHRSVIVLGGKFVDWVKEGAPVDQKHRNPLIEFAKNKEGFVLRMLAEVLTQKDFQGKPQSATEAMLGALAPTTISQAAAKGSPWQKVIGALAEFVGMRTWPQSDPAAAKQERREKAAAKPAAK